MSCIVLDRYDSESLTSCSATFAPQPLLLWIYAAVFISWVMAFVDLVVVLATFVVVIAASEYFCFVVVCCLRH